MLVSVALMADYDWYCEDVFSGKLEVDRFYEDERVLAFHHPRPITKIHVVAVPKAHVPHMHWHIMGPGVD
jgi:diadenosine tetraphosphate (Ap4A) HIT family hydrolase